MRTTAATFYFLIAILPAHASPARVVSANLCADQLLLAFAEPGQIASLSPLAADPAMSFSAGKARPYPANRGSGEDIVRLDADLVLTGPYDSRTTRALLAARGLPFATVSPWDHFATGEKELRDIAARLGAPARAEPMIAAIEAARTRARDIVPARPDGTRPTFLVLSRRGYVFHAGLTASIAVDAGLRDLAPQIGVQGAGFVSMEALIAARPDYLIVSDVDSGAEDQGQAFLRHPALMALWPPERRLVVPDRLTLCEGPSTPALIDTLASEIRTKVR